MTATNGFDQFWAVYPRKVAKVAARKAWNVLRPGPDLVARMILALVVQKQSRDWTKDDGQFIPHPATWLRGERWEDEVEGRPQPEHRCPHEPPCGTTPEWPEATAFRCEQRTALEMARAGKLEFL